MKKNTRGSITPFFIIALTLIIIIGLIIFEYTFYKFNYSKQKVEMYMQMDKIMSGYNRTMFNEIGILGVAKVGLKRPISDSEVLEKQIEKLMEQKHLVKTISKAEDIVADFIDKKASVDVKAFDIGYLNNRLYEIVNGNASYDEIVKFTTNLASVSLYAQLQGLSVSDLKELLENLEFKKIKELKPVFVLKPSIRENFEKIINASKKYDRIGVYNTIH